jgi:hypothetical protein
MPDIKAGGIGTLVGAGAIVAAGALGWLPVDTEKAIKDATVSELVSAKADDSTKAYAAADVIRPAQKELSYDIKPAVIDEKDGKVLAPAETLKVFEVDVPRVVQRPEATLTPIGIVAGDTLRVVVYRGEKVAAVWQQEITEPAATENNELRAYIQVQIRDQVVR